MENFDFMETPITEEKAEPISVYVRTNDEGEVIEVGSSVFIQDFTGWQKIDEGFGDKYAHAQSQYFDKPLINDNGMYNFKLKDGVIVEA